MLECDSLGNAYIKELFLLKGAYGSKPKFEIKHNVLTVVAPVDSQAIYLQLRDRSETRSTVITNTSAPIEVNVLTGFQWFQIWLGRLLLLVFILYVILKLLIPKIL